MHSLFHYGVNSPNTFMRTRAKYAKVINGITLWNRAKIQSNKVIPRNDPNFDFFFAFFRLDL